MRIETEIFIYEQFSKRLDNLWNSQRPDKYDREVLLNTVRERFIMFNVENDSLKLIYIISHYHFERTINVKQLQFKMDFVVHPEKLALTHSHLFTIGGDLK